VDGVSGTAMFECHCKKNQKKNVDIKFNAHDTFLKLPSSGTLKVEKLENQICFFKSFGAIKTKGLNRITKIC